MNVTIGTNKKVLYGLLGLLFGLAISAPIRADLNIAQTPLFLTPSVDPNIMFVIDDSGSMHWETMPDPGVTYKLSSTIANLLMWLYPRVTGLHGGTDYSNTRIPRFTGNLAAFIRSSHNNTVYYNPAITYRPWVNADGSEMPNAPPNAAPNRPRFDGSVVGNTDFGVRNLEQEFSYNHWRNGPTDIGHQDEVVNNIWPSLYYHYNGVGSVDVEANYTRVEIRPENAPFIGHGRVSRTDCAVVDSCTYAEEIQNFANWYTYHRNRIFASRAGIGRAFAPFDGGMRVGFGAINYRRTATNNVTLDGLSARNRTILDGVRDFTGTNKENFYTRLYDRGFPGDGTALRRGLDGAGQYFSRTDNQGPWSTTPGASGGEDLTCRHSYTILMTDGFATGGTDWDADHADRRANTDGTTSGNTTNVHPDHTLENPLNFTYSASDPYQDTFSNTLADIAMYYWKRDLRPDLANQVPTTNQNPAFWQHMVTYGIGLGVEGSVNPTLAWQAVQDGTAIAWPDPAFGTVNCGAVAGACEARIDDLLHASINGRGGFFSAADPDTFATELSNTLNSIVARTEGSSASVATNSTRLDTNTVVYQAKFDSRDWTGQFLAFKICNAALIADSQCTSIGSIVTPFVWDAGQKVTAQGMAGRSLFSFDPLASPQGIVFEYGNLNPSQQALFPDGADQVNYIRGDQSQEQQFGGAYRNRTGPNRLLGDLINSDPWFIGNSNFGYNLLPGDEGTDYLTYRNSAAYKDRKPLIAIGGNDGMLHVFDPAITGATAGNEVFAYVPHTLFAGNKLASLTDPAYTHQYFVDGSPIAGDAYFDADGNGDKEWRTVLVATLGAGGKGVFALDMTFLNPGNYATAEPIFSANRILWEINSDLADFADLGFTVGQASIVRMANGEFAAVFGNGYNSANHKAVLYIVDIKTGALIKAFDTDVGTLGNPNGLASPLAVDANSDRIVDAIYAGDLHGNLWKFDVSDADPNNWSFGFDNAGDPAPLFVAKDASNAVQPITAKPQAGLHPNGGLMIYFGTGRYFVDGDHIVSSPQIQTFYGIHDACVNMAGGPGTCSTSPPSITRAADLVKQEILSEQVEGNYEVRVTTNAVTNIVTYLGTKKGWYMDLVPPSGVAEGERVVTQALLRSGRIIFVTLIPDPSPCNYGGTGWLMELDAVTGNRLKETPFDISGDGLIDSDDMVDFDLNNDGNAVSVSASGKKSKVGIIKTPAVIDENLYTSGSTGDHEVTKRPGDDRGRQSWRQLR